MPATLSPTELIGRQRADHLLLTALDEADCPISVTGHRSANEARANRKPVALGVKLPPSHYRVVYDFDTLRAPGTRHRPTIVHVAPLAGGSYPTTSPGAWVISGVIPWTPHFAPQVPICHGGHVWTPNRTQLVDYVVHIGKLLNFDEPPPHPGYVGYNAAAVSYWRDTMQLAPLDPKLKFPAMRLEDLTSETPRFAGARTSQAARFAPAVDPQRSGGPRFQPAKASDTARFAPVGPRS